MFIGILNLIMEKIFWSLKKILIKSFFSDETFYKLIEETFFSIEFNILRCHYYNKKPIKIHFIKDISTDFKIKI